MRIFVITASGLSVGPPGTTVSAVKLRMSDDKLDRFVEAGYAVEIHGSSPDPRVDTVPDVDLKALGPPPKPRRPRAKKRR